MGSSFLFSTVALFSSSSDSGPGSSFSHDQLNREPLWPSNYTNTTYVQRVTLLNEMRSHINSSDLVWRGHSFINDTARIVQSDSQTVAIRKGPVLSILSTVRCPCSCIHLARQKLTSLFLRACCRGELPRSTRLLV